MKFLNNFVVLLAILSMTVFAQNRPTINGQFVYQQADCENSTYSTILQIGISDWSAPVTLEQVKTRFSFNTAGIEFYSAEMLNFTLANGYESAVYLSSDSGKIWVEFELQEGGTGFAISPNDFVSCVQFNFTILDCNEFANICPFEPQIFRAIDINGNLTIGDWACDETPLPVELTSFTAQSIGNNVILNWSTATEINNYGFNVQRNGTNVGFVSGYGNSNSPKSYSFTDVLETSGTYLYRLQQVDADGTIELSREITVDVILDRFELLQNYPNPFNPSTIIGFYLDRAQNVTLTVYDIMGTEIKVLSKGFQHEGYNEVVFNADNSASGIYIYTLKTETGQISKSMILVK